MNASGSLDGYERTDLKWQIKKEFSEKLKAPEDEKKHAFFFNKAWLEVLANSIFKTS